MEGSETKKGREEMRGLQKLTHREGNRDYEQPGGKQDRHREKG